MPLPAGSRLGRYEVRTQLGAGGMGEVYRAHDPKLNRDVAIKVLPSVFSADAERLRRFELEAQAAGALNHPNILAIYDVDTHDGSPYVVSELLEGETLREQMGGAALPLRKAVDYSLQVAHGLAAAHGRGIVHRDLKPENIFVTRDVRVKILDFGIAKLMEPKDGTEARTDLPTRKLNTEPGTVVGTAGYMSPEQVRGQRVDHRSDIFSFGAVLYEMLSGRRAFRGNSAVETLNAILKEDPPDLSTTNGQISLALERVVRHCLEKNPDERFQSARDLAFALESLSSSSTSGQSVPPAALPLPRSRLREHLPWIIAGLLLLTTAAFATLYLRRGTTEARAVRFLVYPPNKGAFPWLSGSSSGSPVISPNGQQLALVVKAEGRTQLFLRPLNSPAAQPLVGTEDAINPFWSPDSRSIGFFAGGRLKRVEVTGGSPLTICEAPVPKDYAVGTWGRDGTILFTARSDAFFRVPAAGGEPTLVLKPDASRQQILYFWPHFLPDGRHFLFCSLAGGPGGMEILVGSLDSKDTKSLMQADSRAVYAPPGYLLFVREGSLLAQAFDAEKLSLSGEPFTVAENLLYFRPIGISDFSVSDNGVLAYRAGTTASRLVWYSREGAEVGAVGAAADYNYPRLSPDGQKLAISIREQRSGTTDVWLFDLAGSTESRFTFDLGVEEPPVWSPDGRQIAFSADRNAPPYLHVKGLTDAGGGEPIAEPGRVQVPWDWAQTPEGQFVIYDVGSAEKGNDLMLLPLWGERKPRPFLDTQFNEVDARFSPDGRSVAYVSNESGRNQVYVRAFQSSSEKWQISAAGGLSPRWRRDGKELFYLAADGTLMSVPVKAGNSFARGTPTALFHVESPRGEYEVSADGRRFLVNTGSGSQSIPVTVVVNWTADLNH